MLMILTVYKHQDANLIEFFHRLLILKLDLLNERKPTQAKKAPSSPIKYIW